MKTNETGWVVRIEGVAKLNTFKTIEEAIKFAEWARGCGYEAKVTCRD